VKSLKLDVNQVFLFPLALDIGEEYRINMSYLVDFKNVSPMGLTSSPFSEALAGLRANEARYFKTKYAVDFITYKVAEKPDLLKYVETILKNERNLIIQANALEVAQMKLLNIVWTFVFYESGLSINVLYDLTNPKNRAVGFKLSFGMDIPEELQSFKFAKRKSTLANVIRGSYFVIKKS
jgi:hypothetical protein